MFRKMLLSFFAVSFLAALLPIMLSWHYMDMGIERFLQEFSEYRISFLQERFARLYENSGNWDFLREGQDVRKMLKDHTAAPAYNVYFPMKKLDTSPRMELAGGWWTAINPHVSIYDKTGNFLAGNTLPGIEPELYPIWTEGGEQSEIVGYLSKLPDFVAEDDKSQANILYTFFCITLLVTSIFAFFCVWGLVRYFRSPINSMMKAGNTLAAGDFSVRVPVRGKDELSVLSGNFNLMAEELEKNSKIQRQWIANTSHDLKTPLTVAIGTLEAVRQGIMPCDKETLDTALNALEDMKSLLGQLHTLNRYDSGILECRPEPVDMAEFLKKLRRAYRPLAQKAGLEFLLDCSEITGVKLWVDPLRVRQIMDNIFSNSLRYTYSGGKIQVSACLIPSCVLPPESVSGCDQGTGVRLQKDLCILWEDSAPCPSSDDMPKIFDRFFRCDQARSFISPNDAVSTGSGLGLSICRELAHQQGGDIFAETSPLGGLRIKILFPVKA